jgi:uncharacterized membrane protein
MSTYVFAVLMGVVTGLRSLTAPAAVSWAAHCGWLHLEETPLAFLGHAVTTYILSALAILELIADKLPKTPSRKAPVGFSARILAGALSGAAFGVASQGLIGLIGGSACGVGGAVLGTLGGYEFRVRLVRATGGKDLRIALLEDLIAVGGALLIVRAIGA